MDASHAPHPCRKTGWNIAQLILHPHPPTPAGRPGRVQDADEAGAWGGKRALPGGATACHSTCPGQWTETTRRQMTRAL